MSLASGTRLGPYEIVAAIGAGGMGEVYKARDTRLDRSVAIKVSKQEYSERFGREARTIAALNHPGICTLHDVGPNYLVMEFIEGERLKGPLPAAQVVKYAVQIADALDAAHTQGVIHRDIKPSNVFVTPRGHTKVLDFGLAKLAELRVEQGTQAETEEMLTSPGSALGTVSYMSPEQARGEPLDARTDLWSLGVLLYEAIGGTRPFAGATSAVVFDAILNKPSAPLPDEVPAELQRIVLRLLEKDRARRYASAAEVRDDLAKLESELSASRSAAAATVPSRAWWKYAVAAAGVAALTLGGVLVWQRNQTPPLTDKDELVLADFANTTGDPVFDVTLRQALAIQIEESPFLKALDDGRVSQTLALMGRKPDERITNQVAREICVRTGVKAMVSGAIAAVGKSFAITLQATNCQSDATLARVQTEAADKEHVLAAVAEAARDLRAKLGESLASIESQKLPSGMEVTTTSLAAFQAFALGREQQLRGFQLAAIPYFQRAIELDPNFASAHALLSVMFGNVGDQRQAREYARKAFALVDRGSERERLFISAQYHSRITGDSGKAIELYQSLVRLYPREAIWHNQLGVMYNGLGQLENAAREYQEYVRLDPEATTVVGYANLMSSYIRLDRFDEARAVAQQLIERGVDSPPVHLALLRLAHIQGDTAAAEREIQWFSGKPEEFQSLNGQANQSRALGQFRKARELQLQVAELRQRRGLTAKGKGKGLPAADAPAGAAPEESDLASLNPESCAGVLRTVRNRMAQGSDQEIDVRINAGVILGLCGDTAAAQRLVDEAVQEGPADTVLNGLMLPIVRAAIELGRNQPDKAIEALRPAAAFESVTGLVTSMRALAYMRSGKGAEAAAEYQKILDHKGANWSPVYAQVMVNLARAAKLAGDIPRVRRAYEDFFALWRDADADAPLLVAAKQEYAALK